MGPAAARPARNPALSTSSRAPSLGPRRSSARSPAPPARAQLSLLAKTCNISKFGSGAQLPESPFYVVVKGTAVVQSHDGETMCVKHEGAFFTRRAGLIHLETRGSRQSRRTLIPSPMVRKSIVKATSSDLARRGTTLEEEEDGTPLTKIVGGEAGSVLWVTAGAFEGFMSKVEEKSREIVREIISTNIGTQLSYVPFIQKAKLTPSNLRALGELCHYQTFASETPVFRQGDAAKMFYIILKGACEISVDVDRLRGKPSSKVVSAGTREVGDSFGVAALVYNAPDRK